MYNYEEVNLKTYSSDDKQFEKYALFKNTQKAEVKEKLENLVNKALYLSQYILAFSIDEPI